jgi:flagellar motility protein MotE (MotC chaperone)
MHQHIAAGLRFNQRTEFVMSLKFEIEQEAFDSLDESKQALYQKHGSAYRLQVEGIDPADELKEALRKEREERASAKKRLSELEQLQRQQEEESLKQREEFKTLYEREQKAKAELAEKYESFAKRIQQKEIESAAVSIASELTRDTKRAELLREKISQFARYSEEGIKFEMGGVEVGREKVLSFLNDNYPFLIDGSGASGGGATGGKSGGAGKKWSDMTEAEHVQLYKQNPDEYRRLRAANGG